MDGARRTATGEEVLAIPEHELVGGEIIERATPSGEHVALHPLRRRVRGRGAGRARHDPDRLLRPVRKTRTLSAWECPGAQARDQATTCKADSRGIAGVGASAARRIAVSSSSVGRTMVFNTLS